jgi:hypothetical protein
LGQPERPDGIREEQFLDHDGIGLVEVPERHHPRSVHDTVEPAVPGRRVVDDAPAEVDIAQIAHHDRGVKSERRQLGFISTGSNHVGASRSQSSDDESANDTGGTNDCDDCLIK